MKNLMRRGAIERENRVDGAAHYAFRIAATKIVEDGFKKRGIFQMLWNFELSTLRIIVATVTIAPK